VIAGSSTSWPSKGDVAAIVILSGCAPGAAGPWPLCCRDLLDKQAAAEQRRFVATSREHGYMEQIQRVQNQQLAGATRTNRDLLAANRQLSAQLPA